MLQVGVFGSRTQYSNWRFLRQYYGGDGWEQVHPVLTQQGQRAISDERKVSGSGKNIFESIQKHLDSQNMMMMSPKDLMDEVQSPGYFYLDVEPINFNPQEWVSLRQKYTSYEGTCPLCCFSDMKGWMLVISVDGLIYRNGRLRPCVHSELDVSVDPAKIRSATRPRTSEEERETPSYQPVQIPWAETTKDSNLNF